MLEDFRTLLLGAIAPGISVSWNERPQASGLPAVLLTVVSSDTAYTYAGPVSVTRDRVQVDIYAGSYAEAVELDRALVLLASGFRGVVGGTRFLAVLIESRFDTAEVADGEAALHRISRDFMVSHKEL